MLKALLDANIIRNLITNIFHLHVGLFEVLVIFDLESKIFDSKIEYIKLRILLVSSKAFTILDIFDIILRIILAFNTAFRQNTINSID